MRPEASPGTRLPDPQRTRVVMVGTRSYAAASGLAELPGVTGNLRTFGRLLREGLGLPGEHCLAFPDAGSDREVCLAVRTAAREAEDLLLVYFAGHGLIEPDSHELYLALQHSDPDDPRYSAVRFAEIRDMVATSRARNRVVILDCCYSGRAIVDTMGAGDNAAETVALAQTETRGAYTLTATSANMPAIARSGERYTVFTGALIGLLEDGIADAGPYLTLHDLFDELRRTLDPQPRQQGTDSVGALALSPNPHTQAVPPPRVEESKDGEHGRGSVIEGREHYEAFYFRTNRWRMAWQRGIALMVMAGPLVGVLVALGVMGWEGPSGAWLDVMGVAWPVLIALAVFTPLAMQYVPGTYELTVNDEGLLLLIGTDQTMLRWDEVHSVTAVRLVRRRGSPHWLLVRPRGGFVPPRRRAWHPHMDRQGNHLIFCDLRRLREPSAFVAAATAAHAGALWDDSYGMRDETSVRFGRDAASRFKVLLALCGGGCVYVSRDAGSWVLTAFTTLPFLLTLAFTVAPVGLYIDDWGLRLRFLHRAVRRPWQDIDDIRLVWDESHEVFYLQVRTSSTARGWPLPYDPATGAYRMDLNLIDFTVPEFSAAFRRFAGPCWQGEKAESDLAHAVPDAETCYSGRFAGPATALTAWVLPAALFAIGMWGAMAWTWEIDAMLPWFVATGCAPLLALLLRPKLELKLGRDGFTLSAGRRRTHVAWQDVSRVTVVRPGCAPESVASLVVWFRDGAPVPSRWRWGKCFEPWSGGVRITRCHAAGLTSVMVTPAQLDRSLQHFAGAAWQPHTPQTT
ncbi:caspase domain-containing protein [Streptomyces sp. NPDC059970]|uniref:caspase family protein n=1 Tax=Streptomyces sp. NPDC059970 TaxID=3347019 RepID=UPI003680581F